MRDEQRNEIPCVEENKVRGCEGTMEALAPDPRTFSVSTGAIARGLMSLQRKYSSSTEKQSTCINSVAHLVINHKCQKEVLSAIVAGEFGRWEENQCLAHTVQFLFPIPLTGSDPYKSFLSFSIVHIYFYLIIRTIIILFFSLSQ